MQVQVIELDTGAKKDGSIYYQATVMGKFNSFGKLKMSTVEVNLTLEQYKIFEKYVGKTIDLDFVIPKPSFPLTLTEGQFGTEAKS
jgi:hypothetical protein